MTAARKLPPPPAPQSSTTTGFRARAVVLRDELRAEVGRLRALSLYAATGRAEARLAQVEAMLDNLAAQARGFAVRPVPSSPSASTTKDQRSCVVCREPGHNVATHGRKKRT